MKDRSQSYLWLHSYTLNHYRTMLALLSFVLTAGFVGRVYSSTSVHVLPTWLYVTVLVVMGLGAVTSLVGIPLFEVRALPEPLQAGLILNGTAFLAYALSVLYFNPKGLTAINVAAFALVGVAFLLDAQQVVAISTHRRSLTKYFQED